MAQTTQTAPNQKETRAFQAEVKEILDLMIHSLYSQREIFLRELISNACDAIDKRRFEALTNKDLAWSEGEPQIRLQPNKSENQLKISDNGIGMTQEEVVENIGTIAHSGTKAFLQSRKELKNNPELIGQFGVGFYSAFMVAEEVILHTQKAGTSEGTVWRSTGDGTYSIESVPRPEGAGTTITLKLRKSEEEDAQDYADEFTVQGLVKKYSDFIAHPIKMKTEKEEPQRDSEGKVIEGKSKKVIVDETLNSQKALWLRSPSEIKEDEYKEFYRHISNDWSDPAKTIHFKAEGAQEFSALLYVPSKKPWNMQFRDNEYGLDLYVKRVFIMDNCSDLLPSYLRFVRGVADSSDLSLNVSREILQKDQQVQQMKKGIVNKILRVLADTLEKEREKYESFWEQFGDVLKEGIPNDYANRDKLQNLVLAHSSHSDKLTTLKEYVSRMPPEQKAIYYITGDSLARVQNSPYLERLKQKSFEVLFMVDPVDEWVMNAVSKFEGHQLTSITSEKLDLDSEQEKKEREEKNKELEVKFADLKQSMLTALGESVREVRFSDRLTDSPACLVSGAGDPSAHMERLLKQMGQEMPKAKRVLEINPGHAVFSRMMLLSDEQRREWAEILYGQALLAEGSQLEDPMRFSRQISKLMTN